MIAEILGWIATVLFSIMLIPQIMKTIEVKHVDGVSFSLFVLALVANIIALIYAYLICQPPLIIKYTIGAVISLLYLFIYFKYRR
jgi:uncharacterized protein with PQ loop repeat